MIDKVVTGMAAAVGGIVDGSSVMIGGFGTAGMPDELIDALIERDVGDLTIISNNAGNCETGGVAFIKAKRIRKIIRSFRRGPRSHAKRRTGRAWMNRLNHDQMAARVARDIPDRAYVNLGIGLPTRIVRCSIWARMAHTSSR